MTHHFFGIKTHKPIASVPDSPEHQPNKKILEQRIALQEKAKQPHIHYENAARAHQQETEAITEEMSEGAREAAVRAARGV